MKNSGSLSRFGVKSGMSTGRQSTIPSVVIPSEKYSLNMSLREIRTCAIDCIVKKEVRTKKKYGFRYSETFSLRQRSVVWITG